MIVLKYLIVFVWFVVREAESGGHSEKKHHEVFKFHVPEVVNHNHHTKYIVIHHHPKAQAKKSQPKAKPEPKIPHFNFNSHHFKTSHKQSSSHSGGHESHAPVHVHKHVEHKVEKTPMHHVPQFHKSPIHHDSPQAPQVFGQTHTYKEVSTYNSHPFASSSPGHGSHSQNGYEVTENEEDQGLGNDEISNTYGPSYGYGSSNQVTSPQAFGSSHNSDPFGGGLVADDENTHYSSDFNYVPGNDGSSYGQSYGGNSFGGNAYEASSYEAPGNSFGAGNSEQLTDEYKEFIKNLDNGSGAAGSGLKSFADDTSQSVTQESGFNKVYKSGGHQSIVY